MVKKLFLLGTILFLFIGCSPTDNSDVQPTQTPYVVTPTPSSLNQAEINEVEVITDSVIDDLNQKLRECQIGERHKLFWNGGVAAYTDYQEWQYLKEAPDFARPCASLSVNYFSDPKEAELFFYRQHLLFHGGSSQGDKPLSLDAGYSDCNNGFCDAKTASLMTSYFLDLDSSLVIVFSRTDRGYWDNENYVYSSFAYPDPYLQEFFEIEYPYVEVLVSR